MTESADNADDTAPFLNADVIRCLRRLLHPQFDAGGHSLGDLVDLSASLPPGDAVTIDFTTRAEIGQPLVVLRRGNVTPTSPGASWPPSGSGDRRLTPAETPPSRDVFRSLTRREAEVVVLIAAGLPNREIAVRLVVTVGTVKDHVHHIIAKTGLRNRAAIGSAWAARGTEHAATTGMD